MNNFYKPTKKALTRDDVLAMFNLGVNVSNYEQQAPVYVFFKKKEKSNSFLSRLMNGFLNPLDIELVIHSTTDKDEMETYINDYIKAMCKDVKKTNKGTYEFLI